MARHKGYGELTLSLLKDGQGIDSVVEEFYLSASGTELTGGSWSSTPPSWHPNTYVWKRYKITYNNPTKVTYTSPVCDAFWDAVGKIEQDIVNVDKKTTTTQVTVDKLKQEVEQKVTQEDINSSINGIRPDIDKANQGLNKWLIEIYDKTALPEDHREDITIDAFFGEKTHPLLKKNILDTDLSTSLHNGNQYLGYAVTFVKFKKETMISTTIDINPLGTLYLNGQDITKAKSNDITMNFVTGWNVIEVVWNVQDTTGGFRFGNSISMHQDCELMNCYYRTITSRDTSLISRYAGIKVNVDSIQTRVSKTESILTTKADGTEVHSLKEQLNESISTLDEFKRTVSQNYATNDTIGSLRTEIQQLSTSITNKVTSEQLNEKIESVMQQTKEQWRIDFAENGATCGSFQVSKNGLVVAGESSQGFKTIITPKEFSGWYNNQKVFWLNQDETVSERLRVEKGIDLRTIKLVPVVQNGHRGLDILGGNAII